MSCARRDGKAGYECNALNHLIVTLNGLASRPDPDHSTEEDRYIMVGMSERSRLLMVAYAERGERVRIISARELTRTEREAYERGN